MKIAFIGDSLTRGRPGSSFVQILSQRLSEDVLINLGKGNDTVVSLYRRLTRIRLDAPLDIAFLWVGVNDVPSENSWLGHAFNALRGQPRSRDLDELRRYYLATLDLLCENARRVIAVSPLLKGEDIRSKVTRKLEVLANAILEMASSYERVEYLDLQAVVYPRLAEVPVSSYCPGSALRVALDVLILRRTEQVNRAAMRRGLYYTLDGLHLNEAGAELVADAFLEAIRSDGSSSLHFSGFEAGPANAQGHS
jgi:lysophospholipase L1-like esterase